MADRETLPAREISDKFFALIGVCITEWAGIDEWIFMNFKYCVYPERQAAIIYYRVPGLDLRLNLTDELIKSILPKREKASGSHSHPLVQEWTDLKNEIQSQLGTRRRIAHQPVTIQQNWLRYFLNGRTELAGNKIDPEQLAEKWFSIHASQHERMREKESDMQPIGMEDLQKHLQKLSSFTPRLVTFHDKLVEFRSSEAR